MVPHLTLYDQLGDMPILGVIVGRGVARSRLDLGKEGERIKEKGSRRRDQGEWIEERRSRRRGRRSRGEGIEQKGGKGRRRRRREVKGSRRKEEKGAGRGRRRRGSIYTFLPFFKRTIRCCQKRTYSRF